MHIYSVLGNILFISYIIISFTNISVVNDTTTPAFSKSKIKDWRPLDLITVVTLIQITLMNLYSTHI